MKHGRGHVPSGVFVLAVEAFLEDRQKRRADELLADQKNRKQDAVEDEQVDVGDGRGAEVVGQGLGLNKSEKLHEDVGHTHNQRRADNAPGQRRTVAGSLCIGRRWSHVLCLTFDVCLMTYHFVGRCRSAARDWAGPQIDRSRSVHIAAGTRRAVLKTFSAQTRHGRGARDGWLVEQL